MGIKVRRDDAEKLRLTDKLRLSVLVNLFLLLGISMLILRSYPVLAKGMSAGRYVDLALAHSLGAGSTPGITLYF